MNKTINNRSGFCVLYTVHESPGKGLGVFAAETIRKDTTIYRNLPELFSVYDEPTLKEYLSKKTNDEVIYELTHMFGLSMFPEHVIRIYDDGVLINHSPRPSTAMGFDYGDIKVTHNDSSHTIQDVERAFLNKRFALIAVKDLNIGYELTMDYDSFVEDPLYFRTLCEQHNLLESYLD